MALPASSPSGEVNRAPVPIAAKRHRLIAEIQRSIQLRCGFRLDEKLIVAVSGGADSLALLIACAVLRGREGTGPGYEPIAVHVNHHLRETSSADARHVRTVCDQLNVPCDVIDIAPGGLEGNMMANARRLRYEALAEAARSRGAFHVAVAHHAEDQLETMLAALCRGTGVEGAAGMRWSRPLGGGVHLIRPLLGATKADCVSLCEAAGIEWREDPTNQDVAFARARLRRNVLPVLEELWPGAAQRAVATGDLLASARESLELRLRAIFGDALIDHWKRDEIAKQDAALLAAGLRRAVLAQSPDLSDELLQRQLIAAADAIRDANRRPREFAVGCGMQLRITAREVRLQSASCD